MNSGVQRSTLVPLVLFGLGILLLIMGSGVMIALGIIGEYVARIYEEVKGRPRYVTAARCGLEPSPPPDR